MDFGNPTLKEKMNYYYCNLQTRTVQTYLVHKNGSSGGGNEQTEKVTHHTSLTDVVTNIWMLGRTSRRNNQREPRPQLKMEL